MVLILYSKDKYLSHIEPIFKFMCYLVLDFSNIVNAIFVKLYQMVFIILFFRGGVGGGQGTKEHVTFIKMFDNSLRPLKTFICNSSLKIHLKIHSTEEILTLYHSCPKTCPNKINSTVLIDAISTVYILIAENNNVATNKKKSF